MSAAGKVAYDDFWPAICERLADPLHADDLGFFRNIKVVVRLQPGKGKPMRCLAAIEDIDRSICLAVAV